MLRWRHEDRDDRSTNTDLSGSEGSLSVDLAQPDRDGRYSGDRRTGRDVPCDHRVCANRSVIADRDSAQHRNTAPDPDFFADSDLLRSVTGFSEATFLSALVVGVADAGVFADHAAGTNRYASHGDNVSAAGDNHSIPDFNPRVVLCFKMQTRVEKYVLSKANVAGPVNESFALDDRRGRQRRR